MAAQPLFNQPHLFTAENIGLGQTFGQPNQNIWLLVTASESAVATVNDSYKANISVMDPYGCHEIVTLFGPQNLLAKNQLMNQLPNGRYIPRIIVLRNMTKSIYYGNRNLKVDVNHQGNIQVNVPVQDVHAQALLQLALQNNILTLFS